MNSSIGHKIGAADAAISPPFSPSDYWRCTRRHGPRDPRSIPVGAAANAVVPDSSITGFTPTQFPANDDGTYPCGGSGNAPAACTGSDTGPATVPLGFNINFFGTEFRLAYVNNNGNITFSEPLSEYTPADLTTFGSPYRPVLRRRGYTDRQHRRIGTGTLNGHKVFVVNWPGVGCYSGIDSVTDDFQLIRTHSRLPTEVPPHSVTTSTWSSTTTAFNGIPERRAAATATVRTRSRSLRHTRATRTGPLTTGDSFNIPGSGVPNGAPTPLPPRD